ncbi:MocR-like pyridoxine biosynthesis transcription factor PdxR [Hirschia baltica]|uniref:Transcriptional regulator, GntR family with aminotransferase domain n=1 Tax=Hirschia baltica (strain ATCC 49814 / DSM 5838 / IFAM 1418) TaxID=582402 RepID=C6XP71_HIRBI|nr:PLP-dependent aminotransferase family protein [Hirschia baltica]ACT60251.1 transcriptional regulator, GntR family with aminotransferase domain [Hirschia baltica ATCC 49814]
MIRTWKVSLSERVASSKSQPLYIQIIQAIIHDIEKGRLAPGEFLPSSRELAQILGVNRKTVVLAYEDLIAQGWLSSEATRGTCVQRALPEAEADSWHTHSSNQDIIHANFEHIRPPQRPLALPATVGLKLDEGSPDGRLFPPELLVRAFRSATHKASQENNLQYRDPRGTYELRSAIAEMLRIQRGLNVTADNICTTRGSQNGIFLASMALLRAGDTVIVESLTYEPAIAAFKALGATIHSVRIDEDGLDIEEVESICKNHRVKAIFVTPHHQFPTTVSLRPDRRLRLIELARQHGFAIIEDDYDHEFHFESQPLLPIASYALDQVIYVGSFSKLLLPSLRVGYVAAPKNVIDALAHLVSLSDGMGNTLTENSVAQLINSGELQRHSRKVKKIYSTRRENFAQTLRNQFGNVVEFRIPEGGLAFWLRIKTDLDALEARAKSQNLTLASSRSFVTRDDASTGLRIGFASLTEDEAQTAITRLAASVQP